MPVEHDDEPHLRDQIFDFRSLPPRLKVLTGVVIAQVVAGAATLGGAVKCCGVTTLGGPEAYLPSVAYALTLVSLMFGLFLVTTGMARAQRAGALALTLVIAGFFATALLGFFSGPFLRLAASVVSVTILWLVLVNAVPAAYRARHGPRPRRMWVLRGFLAVGLGLWALVLFASPLALGTLLVILHQALVFFYVLAGADWAELSDTVARYATRTRFVPRARSVAPLYATAGLAVGMIIVTALRSPPRIFVFALAELPVIAAVFGALRLAGFHAGWPRRFTWPALAAVAFSTIFGNVAIMHGASWVSVEATYAVIMAVILIAGGRSPHYATIGPAAIMGLVYALNTLLSVRINSAFVPYLSANGIFLAGATLALVGAAWLWRRGRLGHEVGEPAGLLLGFVTGLWLLYLLWAGLYEMLRHAGEKAAIAAGVVVLVTILVDMALLGGSVTNVDGRLFPRAARVRLFFGYVLLVVASVLFWGSIQGSGEVTAIAKAYSPDLFVQAGIAGYGVSMLTALVILRLAHWRQTAPPLQRELAQ